MYTEITNSAINTQHDTPFDCESILCVNRHLLISYQSVNIWPYIIKVLQGTMQELPAGSAEGVTPTATHGLGGGAGAGTLRSNFCTNNSRSVNPTTGVVTAATTRSTLDICPQCPRSAYSVEHGQGAAADHSPGGR